MRLVAVATVTSGAGIFAVVGTASASAHATKSCKADSGVVKIKDSAICRGLRYFSGKTITLIAGGAPGGSFDALARSIQPELQSYLGATVNVVDQSSATAAQNDVAAAAPTGLTLGELNMVPDAVGVATSQPVVNFNPAREQIYGAEGSNADMYVVTKGSPWQSWSQLINNTSASNPVPELALSSGFDTSVQLLTNAAFGIHAHIISGYANEAALVSGFDRGDGDWMLGPLTSTGPMVPFGSSVGIANAVAIAHAAPTQGIYYSRISSVPFISALEKQFPAKTAAEKLARTALNAFIPAGAQVVFAAAKTPSYIDQTLTAAMYWTVRTPQEQQAALLRNLTPGWQSPTKMRNTYKTMLTLAPKLASVFAGF
jgi:hypothetical protein